MRDLSHNLVEQLVDIDALPDPVRVVRGGRAFWDFGGGIFAPVIGGGDGPEDDPKDPPDPDPKDPPDPENDPDDPTFTQKDVSDAATKAAKQAARAAERKAREDLASQLGVSVDEAARIIAQHKKDADASKSEADRLKEQAQADRDEALRDRRAALDDRRAAALDRALAPLAIDKDVHADVLLLVNAELGDPPEGEVHPQDVIDDAIDAVRTRLPALFGESDDDDDDDRTPPARGVHPEGGTRRPRGGKGSGDDALEAGRRRAREYQGLPEPEPAKT